MPKKYWLFLLAVTVGLAFSVWLGSRLPKPTLQSPEVGSRGGIRLLFATEMQPESVTGRFTITSGEEYWLVYEGKELTAWPRTYWKAGEVISFQLADGAESVDGRKITAGMSGVVHVRQPEIVYLSLRSGMADIWKINAAGEEQPLSDQGEGGVSELAVSTDGEWIVYSRENEMGGADLWIMDRSGGQRREAQACGSAICGEMAWQPGSQRIAYSQYFEGSSGQPQVWIQDVASGNTVPFFADVDMAGMLPGFSPDGKYISLYSPELGGVFVQRLADGKTSILETSIPQPALWSADSRAVYLLKSLALEGQPADKVYRFNLEDSRMDLALGTKDDAYNYGAPAINPQDGKVAAPVRQLEGGLSSQVWLFEIGEERVQPITNEPAFIHGNLSWNPEGSQLLIQRFMVDSSEQLPQILVWDTGDGEISRIIENGIQAEWLP